MEKVELPKHLVVLGARGLQDPPLGQEIQMAQDLQTVLFPPLILENLEIHRSLGHPEGPRTQECPFLLSPQFQAPPWVLGVLEVQPFQAFLLHPFLLYREKNQGAVSVGWVQENLAGQPHPGLPFAPLLLHQDYPSNLDSQPGPEVLLSPALLDIPLDLPGLSNPWVLVSLEVLGPLCHPEYL